MFVHMWRWFFVKLFWVRLDGFSLFKKQRNCNYLISKTFKIHVLRIKINKIHIYGNFNKKKKAQESVIKWRSMNLIPFVFFFTSTCWEKKIKPTFIGRYWYIINTGWCKLISINFKEGHKINILKSHFYRPLLPR